VANGFYKNGGQRARREGAQKIQSKTFQDKFLPGGEFYRSNHDEDILRASAKQAANQRQIMMSLYRIKSKQTTLSLT
jgi:hypothetical protein